MPINTTPALGRTDLQRAARLLVGWADGDELAITTVLSEAAGDPAGVSGLLFAVTHTAALLAEDAAPEGTSVAGNLRALLLDLIRESE